MSELIVGKLFEYMEPPIRIIVKLTAFRMVGPADETMGKMRFWTWEVVDRSSSLIRIGDSFTTMDREYGPSYSWHATELNGKQAAPYLAAKTNCLY